MRYVILRRRTHAITELMGKCVEKLNISMYISYLQVASLSPKQTQITLQKKLKTKDQRSIFLNLP